MHAGRAASCHQVVYGRVATWPLLCCRHINCTAWEYIWRGSASIAPRRLPAEPACPVLPSALLCHCPACLLPCSALLCPALPCPALHPACLRCLICLHACPSLPCLACMHVPPSWLTCLPCLACLPACLPACQRLFCVRARLSRNGPHPDWLPPSGLWLSCNTQLEWRLQTAYLQRSISEQPSPARVPLTSHRQACRPGVAWPAAPNTPPRCLAVWLCWIAAQLKVVVAAP